MNLNLTKGLNLPSFGVKIVTNKKRGKKMNENLLRRGRIMYIIEAGIEYLISIMVANTYLALLTKELGISDSLTGIISSFISLGCVFQLCSILIRKRRSKGFVLVLSVLNQLLFISLYVVPLVGGNDSFKSILFIVIILLAYFFYYIAHPKKIDWLMSLVDDDKRGVFTARKEIISLIMGMVFSFAMGALIDHYGARGEIRIAFVISAIVMSVLMVIHTLTMVLTIEKPREIAKERKIDFKAVFTDKKIIKISIVFMLWYIASYSATPFYGAYQIADDGLGFSQTFVAVLSAIYAVARILFSIIWGKYADKFSFAKMLRICFLIAGVGFLINVFCVPENGHIVYTAYYICNAIAMAGINSALINLCFDYVDESKRADALAVSLALAGVCGFGATLIMSALVSKIQANGNSFLGMSLFAPQVLSAIAFVLTMVTMLYAIFAFKNEGRINEK